MRRHRRVGNRLSSNYTVLYTDGQFYQKIEKKLKDSKMNLVI